jgi:ornithine carbamoyltransferase
VTKKRDFLRIADLSADERKGLFARAHAVKASRKAGKVERTLEGRTLALIFEKHSTRTKLSFEAAAYQLGGSAISLSAETSQMSRGESIADTSRVVARYSDAIVVRTHADARLEEFARASTVPVINGLSDGGHPVQILTDLFTVEERLGEVKDKVIAWVGDGASNMALSWIEAAPLFGFQFHLCAPEGYRPSASVVEAAKGRVKLFDDPSAAVKGADVVTTDVWTSMGQEAETAKRKAAFAGYCVDVRLMSLAKPQAIVLHCLPAHRGEEITEEVMEGPQSAIFDEAENRMHVQKALIELMILGRFG